MGSSSAANRAAWDARADEYGRTHGPFLAGAAWGVWRIPESELRAPEGATTTFGFDAEWARRWPSENVWVARKRL